MQQHSFPGTDRGAAAVGARRIRSPRATPISRDHCIRVPSRHRHQRHGNFTGTTTACPETRSPPCAN